MKKVLTYVDGFNLYHAIDDLSRPHLKWLDLWALGQSILRDGERLDGVYYFSAYATWLPGAAGRHREYVKALQHAGVMLCMGHFKEKHRECKACKVKWIGHEEKESDVHLAVRLVADAYEDKFDRAIIITADSDIVPAIRIVEASFPRKQIFVVSPPGRHAHARDLQPRLSLTQGRLGKCLLPEIIKDPGGNVLVRRPANYLPPVGTN